LPPNRRRRAGTTAATYACAAKNNASAAPTPFDVSKALATAIVMAVDDAEIACTFPGSNSPTCQLNDAQVAVVARAQVSGFAKNFAMAQGMCGCAINANKTMAALLPMLASQAVAVHSDDCMTRAHPSACGIHDIR
jgi:hypothetical protein